MELEDLVAMMDLRDFAAMMHPRLSPAYIQRLRAVLKSSLARMGSVVICKLD